MNREIRTVITRRVDYDDNKFFISTNSFKNVVGWSNCLYIHFLKKDFPNIEYPPLEPCDWGWKRYFDCDSTNLNKLPFHGGITFYEETACGESGNTIVKVGCDYSHGGDDVWRKSDNGEVIIKSDGIQLANKFIELFCNKKPGDEG